MPLWLMSLPNRLGSSRLDLRRGVRPGVYRPRNWPRQSGCTETPLSTWKPANEPTRAFTYCLACRRTLTFARLKNSSGLFRPSTNFRAVAWPSHVLLLLPRPPNQARTRGRPLIGPQKGRAAIAE